jgi:hypothetical protein
MLFKILKLFGLDVPAKVDAAKALIEERAAEVADRARHMALSAALIVALSTFAGLFLTMAIGIGLLALYHTEEAAFGTNVALGIVAAVLVAATLILLTIALMLGKSLSGKRAPELPNDVATPSVAPATRLARVPPPTVLESEATVSAGDFIEPVSFLLARYVKFPVLGHPVLNEIVDRLRVTAQGTTGEAVERAANIVRYGGRGQLLMLLGGAAVAGWLLARQRSDQTLHEVVPAG